MILKLKYLSREKSGLFLYYRQIPEPLRPHYEGRIFRRKTLRTHDAGIAAREALKLAGIDDQIWQALRDGAVNIEEARVSLSGTVDSLHLKRIIEIAAKPRKKLSDALEIYLRKNRGKDEKALENVQRAFARATDILGNPALEDVKRIDARRVLDSMLGTGLKTASVKRYLDTISAIFSVAILEFELDRTNPFSALTIPNLLEDAREVPSFTESELRQIADAALTQKIEPGLIACMQIETGCRVREIAMLRVGDIHLDAEIPYIEIKQHLEHGRRLKTGKSSERVLPLLGVSLEAGRIAHGAADGKGWLFPCTSKVNPAGTVNRWIVRTIGSGKSSHSARHSMESRLILARTDQRITDTILGHKTLGMGSVYFSGYSISDLAEALSRIAIL
jgi:integrase